MKRWRSLLPFILMISVAAGIVWLSLRDGAQQTGDSTASEQREPRYTTEQATWTRYGSDGLPLMRAQAAHIDYFEDRSMEMQTVVLDRVGGEQGHWHLSAPTGMVPPGQERIRLGPDVQINGAARANLPTEIAAKEVWVDWNKREIVSDKPVRARAPGRVLLGDSWSSDFAATRAKLKGNVQVEYDAPQR